MGPQGIVYILTNKHHTTLYTGVTRNLQRRLAEHKLHVNQGFTAKYKTDILVYYELFDRLDDAIHREKQLKKYHRDWKEQLINSVNPTWKDLASDIRVDANYIQAIKEAYNSGLFVTEEYYHPVERGRDGIGLAETQPLQAHFRNMPAKEPSAI